MEKKAEARGKAGKEGDKNREEARAAAGFSLFAYTEFLIGLGDEVVYSACVGIMGPF